MKRYKHIVIKTLLALLFLSVSDLFAQLKKANNHFNQMNYADAIPHYHSVLKKDSLNKEAIKKIAISYRKLKDYNNAEIYFSKAVKYNPKDTLSYLYYGQTLKNNNKVEEASIQFKKFLDKKPNSLIGKLMLQSCKDILNWSIAEKAFDVALVENINSENADFCPLYYKSGLIFVSEREIDLVNELEYKYSNKPYLSVFYAKKDKQYKKVKKFDNQLASLYHDGPISISEDGKTIYLTRAGKEEKGKDFLNRSGIYYAHLDEKKWGDITSFIHNSPSYSVAHPCLSRDGKRLFFSSDMPNGYGGMDLYVCHKDGENWGPPINLGEHINTSQDEVFPYFRKKTLYFSSDGHSGYGGLDILSARDTNNWKDPVNLKEPLNSSKDDFGIFYKDDENGFFSSNREGGVGSDDIYSFKWSSLGELTHLSGLLEFKRLGLSTTSISLLDRHDNVLETIKTDSLGRFMFDRLIVGREYIIRMNEGDTGIQNNTELYITNSNGDKVLIANKLDSGRFNFQSLPFEYYDGLELIEEKDNGSLFTVSLRGQVYTKVPGDYVGTSDIYAEDRDGNVIGKSKIDKTGKFMFDKLPPEKQYLLRLAEDDESLKIVIIDDKGSYIEIAKRLIEGKYLYRRLGADQNILSLINEEDEIVKIAENESFVISNILYEYNSDKIDAIAKKELDKLVIILRKNKNIRVELSSHTDAIGGNNFNMKLSQKRANRATNYIISKGISSSFISAKGHGETRPIAPNKLANGEDNPEGRAKNRRTEFKVVLLNQGKK